MPTLPVLLAACLLGQAPATGAPAGLTVVEVLDRWEAGARKIESYELFVELIDESHILRVDGVNRIVPVVDPASAVHYYSHLWKKGPKRFGLFREGPTARNRMTRAFDGRQLVHSQSADEYSIEGDFISFGSVERDDYETAYRTLFGSGDRIAQSKARASRLLARDGNLYVVDVPQAAPGPFWELTWKIWLDPDRNFLPVRWSETIVKPGQRLHSAEVAVALKEVASGVWAPVEMRTTVFHKDPGSDLFGQAMGQSILKVDLLNSRFNIPIPDDKLTLIIPKGATVIDRVRKKIYYQDLDQPHPLDGIVIIR